MNLIEKVKNIISTHYLLSKYEKNYVRQKKIRWTQNLKFKNSKNVVLVDFFGWSPWIHIWSYLTNILSSNHSAKIEYFYFHLIEWKTTRFKIFFRKLKKIYNSFNAFKGLFELDFKYSKKEKEQYVKILEKICNNKKKLISYKIDDIVVGDLIYDTYMRTTFKPTADLKSPEFINLFIRSHKIFYEIKKYFNRYNVVAVIPSHTFYVPYGIIMRFALNKNIPVYKILSQDRGSIDFKLCKIYKNFPLEEQPFHKYKKIFNKKT